MKLKKNAKRVTSFFLALVMVISLFAGFEFETEAAAIPAYTQASEVFADANGDGIINRLDPIRTRRNATGEVTENNQSDINGDGAVDTLDVVLSKKMAAGELDEASFYSREITGDTYKFIFGRMAHATTKTMNELTWDAEENAYHYHIDGSVPNGYADRRIWFDASFVNKVIQYTGATSMTFDIKASAPQSTDESILYYTVSPADYLTLSSNVVTITPPTTYQTIEVNFSELPLDGNNNMMMPLLIFQHGDGDSVDLYISNITFHVPEDEDDVEYTVDTTVGTKYFGTDFTVTNPTVQDAAYTWTENNASGEKWSVCSAAASICGLKFTLKEPIKNVTSDMKLRLYIHGGWGDSGDATFRLYHLDTTMHRDLASCVKGVAKENDWTYVTLDLSKLVDEDGTFRGFQFVDYNTTCDRWYFHYMEILTGTQTVEWEAYTDKIQFNETNFSHGAATVDNGSAFHNSVSVSQATYENYDSFYVASSDASAPYFGQRFELNSPIKNVTSDMKLQMRVYASFYNENVNVTSTPNATFRLYPLSYTGASSSGFIVNSVPYKTPTTIEISLSDFVESDGTFRGFQFGNVCDADTLYWFEWIQIYREKPEDVWEEHGKRDFSTADFTCTDVGLSGLHNSVSGAYTTLDGRDAYYFYNNYASSNQYPDFGRTFTLNTPISHVTSDMKLRMRVMVVGDGTTDAWFRLYNLSQTSLSNAGTYVDVYVPYSEATIVEIDITNLLDSDGTFSGFQLRNLTGSATVTYYFNWIDIVKLQEEFDPDGYSLDFKEENVTVSAMDLEGINNEYIGTFTAEDSNNILSFANSTKYTFGGKKVTFKQSIENCTGDMLVTFRMKVTIPDNKNTAVNSERVTIRLHIADAYGPQADNSYTDIVVPVVGEWTDVTCSLENLLVDGKFDGFFWSNFTNNYTVSFASLTIQQSDAILTNGVSTYQLLKPADSSELIDTAATEFNTFFKEATGTELAVVSDDAVVEGQKYISIGETSLLADTGITYETSELGSDGFKIVTKDSNIYAIGGSDYGTLYAVYELLAQLVGYDYIYKDTYTLDKNVKDIPLQDFNICEVPDIATRTASDGVVSGDAMSLYRMRVRPYSESMVWTGTDWVHTSFHFVNGVASDGTTNANVNDKWFNSDKTQLCYTAQGDSEAYEAMLDACLNTLKGAIKRFGGSRRNVVFGNQDNDATCTCTSCAEMKEQYGADSAAAILFLQDLQEKLEAWFTTDEGSKYAGEFNIIFLAYKGYEDAPTNLPRDLKYDVNCMISAIKVDYYQPITAENTTNATYYNTITKWGEITDKLYTWYYGTNFQHYLAPYDNISNMQTNYQLAVESGAEYMFDQRQHNETGFVTGWSNLKSYLSSKLAWDVNADVDTLTKQFFEAYFGPAATNMRSYYDGLVTLTHTNLSANNGFGGTKSVVQDLINSTYWPEATLEEWIGYCDAALTDIASLESSDPELYQKYKNHIEGEKLAILYLYIECYLNYSNAVAMHPYMKQVKEIAENLGVTKYSEAGNISALLDKWGVSATDTQVVWTHGTELSGADTGFDGVNESGTVSYNNGVWKLANCYEYSAHKLAFVNPSTYTGNETVTIKIKATPSTSGMSNLTLCLYPYTKTGSMGNWDEYTRGVEVEQQGTETTITFDIADYLDDNGKFIGFGFITEGYEDWSTGQMYTIEIMDIAVN